MSRRLSFSQYQRELWRLHSLYQDDVFTLPPSQVEASTCHWELSERQVHESAVLLSRFLGMHGSNGSDFDLYKVLKAYILDVEKRAEINNAL